MERVRIVHLPESKGIDFSRSYVTVAIPGLQQLTASLEVGPRFIGDGISTPVFTDAFIEAPVYVMDEVAMKVAIVNGFPKVMFFGFAKFYRNSLKRIAALPQYQVIRQNRLQGKLMGGSTRNEVVFTGNLKELISTCPRDGLKISTVDQFAPTYKTGPVTALNSYRVMYPGGGDWKECADPRPLPVVESSVQMATSPATTDTGTTPPPPPAPVPAKKSVAPPKQAPKPMSKVVTNLAELLVTVEKK